MKAITSSGNPNIEHIESVIDIIRNFTDGLHHTKEENLLFPALGNKGFSPQQGPVSVMLHEHVEGRNYVKGMAENLELFKKGSKDAIAMLYQNMSDYAELLFNHINKENTILFRMADNMLSDDEQKNLLEQFVTIEQKRPGGTRAEDYINRINDLALIYKI